MCVDDSVWNSKQKCNHDDYQCDFKELDYWGSFEKGYMWNLSMFDCECSKAFRIDEYLNTKICLW